MTFLSGTHPVSWKRPRFPHCFSGKQSHKNGLKYTQNLGGFHIDASVSDKLTFPTQRSPCGHQCARVAWSWLGLDLNVLVLGDVNVTECPHRDITTTVRVCGGL